MEHFITSRLWFDAFPCLNGGFVTDLVVTMIPNEETDMIEVLFGESEAASMKAAKTKVILGHVSGPTSVWKSGKKTPPERPFTGWVEGTVEEVICLGFMLDIGNIKEAVDSQYRKHLIYSMYAQNQYGKNPEIDEELKLTGEVYTNELLRLRKYLEDGEIIRIWYSDAPYSRCGFYSLCQMLKNYKNEIHVVKLPEYVVRKTSVISYRNWGEVSAEEFAGFLSYERILTKEAVGIYALLWAELTEDNSPLRAVINGRITGVQEDFYDFLIWKKLTYKPVKEARLIGDILGNFQIGMGDWWFAKRIEYFIQQDKIKVLEDSENKYARVICMADGRG